MSSAARFARSSGVATYFRQHAASNAGAAAFSRRSSDMSDLSNDIEKLGARSTASGSTGGSVHTPRSPSTGFGKDRQTVHGRAFLNGHYYNPSTLSYQSIVDKPPRPARPLLGPSNKEAKAQDLLHINSLKPGKPSLHDDSYKNGAILANYITEMGKIMPRSATGLTRKSQRNVGKAIRRARAMGLLPVMNRGGSRSNGAGWK